MTKFLLLDAHNLAYRCLHSTGKKMDLGTTFGFLRELHSLKGTFPDFRFIFFWDHGQPKRQEILPTYKTSRRARLAKLSEEEQEAHRQFQCEVDTIKHELLWDLGYANIRWQSGMEADDLAARFCLDMPVGSRAVIVSNDQDMYQCLERGRVSIYKPTQGEIYTEGKFIKEWGIEPSRWSCVKAIAGCSSDDIPGVAGVGLITAIKFLTNRMPKKGVIYNRILEGEARWLRNQRLVRLPHPDVRGFSLKEDSVTKKKWGEVVRNLGMVSLLGWI